MRRKIIAKIVAVLCVISSVYVVPLSVEAQSPPQVTSRPATNIKANSATLNGNLTNLGNYSWVLVSFEWGTSTTYGNETTAGNVTSPGVFSDNLGGLSAGTTYHFRAKAVGNGTDTAYGDDMTFATPLPLAEISISEFLDADRVATVKATVVRIKDQSTGEILESIAPACYQGNATYNTTGIRMLTVRGGDPAFNNPVFNIDNTLGRTNFAQATVLGQSTPITVAKLVPRLLGSASTPYSINISFGLICDHEGNVITAPEAPQTLSFRRGDVNGDGNVNIVDAMYGSQYLVGAREDIRFLNMASVHQDSSADKVDIVDCMYIAQYAVGTRNANFEMGTVPTPGPTPGPTPTPTTTPCPGCPAAPTLISPANGTNVAGSSIAFSWSAPAGATTYWLEVNRDPNWGSGTRFYYGWGDAATRSMTVNGFLNNGTTYYWRVWAGNSYGWSAPSSSWSVVNGW